MELAAAAAKIDKQDAVSEHVATDKNFWRLIFTDYAFEDVKYLQERLRELDERGESGERKGMGRKGGDEGKKGPKIDLPGGLPAFL